MSVLRISKRHFESVANKIAGYAFQNIVDREYCGTFYYRAMGAGDPDTRAKEFVELLDEMNDLSCYYHTRENKADTDYMPASYNIGSAALKNAARLDCFGMLKALQCIAYNIELDEIPTNWAGAAKMDKYKNALNTLREAIREIQGNIISDMAEYKAAEWTIE